jgi:D-alanyl-D-alanine carboxypeptidase
VATYNGYVASRGQADADTASARPGYSEHQTGWSFDIADGGGACSFQPCFADQPAAVWAKANGHRFGFVVRYPWMFHPITGYYYEPWHLRYIGVEAATDMMNRGINTLEEYFGVEAAPGYRDGLSAGTVPNTPEEFTGWSHHAHDAGLAWFLC